MLPQRWMKTRTRHKIEHAKNGPPPCDGQILAFLLTEGDSEIGDKEHTISSSFEVPSPKNELKIHACNEMEELI